jgi:hypothetical protein
MHLCGRPSQPCDDAFCQGDVDGDPAAMQVVIDRIEGWRMGLAPAVLSCRVGHSIVLRQLPSLQTGWSAPRDGVQVFSTVRDLETAEETQAIAFPSRAEVILVPIPSL